MAESTNIDAAMRIKEINTAREKIKAEPYLLGDKEIKESLKYGLCTNLVLNDPGYQNSLSELKELERIAKEKAEEEARISSEKRRIAKEKAAEEARIAREKAKEEARIVREKAAEEARIAREKAEEEARIAQEKAEEEMKIKREGAKRKYANNIINKRDLDNFELIFRKIRLVRYKYEGKDKFQLRVILDKKQCLKISDLDLQLEFLTIHKDVIKQKSVIVEKTGKPYTPLNSFSTYDCTKPFEERVSISEEDYMKLEKIKSVEKIKKDIDLFDEISLKIARGTWYPCSKRDRERHMIDLCPQDFPPLKNNRGPEVNISSYIKEYKWINE